LEHPKHGDGFEMLMPNLLISIRYRFSLKCLCLSSNWLKKTQIQNIYYATSRGQHGISRVTLQKGNNALARQQGLATA